MSYLSIFASIAVIHLLAVASPGPTLMVVMSQAVAGSRRSGFLVVTGVVRYPDGRVARQPFTTRYGTEG